MSNAIHGSWTLVVFHDDNVYARRILRAGTSLAEVSFYALTELPPDAPARELFRLLLERFVLAVPV
ncbi:MAG TPA: hypothetical protein VNO30_47985 [Kofleriaceae bacterium]|nr:hypothetical protein [Kofleriaceae bacterium]